MSETDDWPLAKHWADENPSARYERAVTKKATSAKRRARWAWEFLRRNALYRECWRALVAHLEAREQLPEWSGFDEAVSRDTSWSIERRSADPSDIRMKAADASWDIPEGYRAPMEIERLWATELEKTWPGYWRIRSPVDPLESKTPDFVTERTLWSASTELPVVVEEGDQRYFLQWGGPPQSTLSKDRVASVPLPPYHVAAVFDLSQPTKPQLDHWRRQISTLRKRLESEGTLQLTQDRRLREIEYPLYLRLLDGEAAGRSVREMTDRLFDLGYERDDQSIRDALAEARALLEPERYSALLR